MKIKIQLLAPGFRLAAPFHGRLLTVGRASFKDQSSGREVDGFVAEIPESAPAEPPAGEKTYSRAELDAALADVRREAAKWRTEHKKAADALEAAAKQKMTEEEKRAADVSKKERELADRETAASERLLSAAIKEAAAAAGVAPARLALIPRLIDRTEVEFDDAGEPTNVPALVKSLLEDPEFKAAAGASGSADGGSRGKSSLTREQIEKMTPAEINSRWAEIQEFLARGARAG